MTPDERDRLRVVETIQDLDHEELGDLSQELKDHGEKAAKALQEVVTLVTSYRTEVLLLSAENKAEVIHKVSELTLAVERLKGDRNSDWNVLKQTLKGDRDHFDERIDRVLDIVQEHKATGNGERPGRLRRPSAKEAGVGTGALGSAGIVLGALGKILGWW